MPNLRVKLAKWLLLKLEPNLDRLIGKIVEQSIDQKVKEWELALLQLQAEIAPEFGGGLKVKAPTTTELCQMMRQETRAWELQAWREHKLLNLLELDKAGAILPRVRGLVKIDFTRERERAIFDDALVEVKRAKNSFNQALVHLEDLRRSFDLEYRVKNVLDFEGKLESEDNNDD